MKIMPGKLRTKPLIATLTLALPLKYTKTRIKLPFFRQLSRIATGMAQIQKKYDKVLKSDGPLLLAANPNKKFSEN